MGSRTDAFMEFVKEGKIIEFGCGGGALLEQLHRQFPTSLIVGVDVSWEALNSANEKALDNVILVNTSAEKQIFPDRSFDTAIFVLAIHEIYSITGPQSALASLQVAYNVLKDGGILVIRDNMKPDPKIVSITFNTSEMEDRLWKFSRQFRPRKVKLKKIGDSKVELDVADAWEFLTKYEDLDSDWEMEETHFPFTESEYDEMLMKFGFRIKEKKFSDRDIAAVLKYMSCDFDFRKAGVVIIAEK